MLSVISIAILIGLCTCLDLCLAPKQKSAFTRYAIYLIITVLPAIYKATIGTTASGDNNYSFSKDWEKFFYPSLLITVIISFILINLFIYRPIKEQFKDKLTGHSITFFDFLFKGYSSFKEEIEKLNTQENTKTSIDEILKLHNTHGTEIAVFIKDIFSLLDSQELKGAEGLNGYIGYVLYSFIRLFIGETLGRFTLRQLDEQTNTMRTSFTTRQNSIPGDIPLNKKNLIVESAKVGKPIIYSRNSSKHYQTRNNSIKNGIYSDYVSSCLLKTKDGKPYYSICLDVKGEEASKRMAALVDSNIFNMISLAISEKIRKIADEQLN